MGEVEASEGLFPACRMTSNIFPWCTFYNLEDLPDFPAIADELAFAGKLARAYDQRLTFHPSHFVKVAAAEEQLLQRSLKELEVHSQVPPLLQACLTCCCYYCVSLSRGLAHQSETVWRGTLR